jgi:hypothetical protein
VDADAARRAFDEVRDDVGFAQDEVVFVPFDAAGPLAIHEAALIPPREMADANDIAVLSAEDVALIDANLDRYRVLCWLGMPDELIRPVLRHELEHGCQWKEGGKPQAELAGALRVLTTLLGYAALPTNGQFYNLIPAERDANAAASEFIRARLGDDETDQLMGRVDPGLLRRQPPAEPYATLGTRAMCHAAIWPVEVEQVLQLNRRSPSDLFTAIRPDGKDVWVQLKGDAELARLAKEVRAARPTRADLDAAHSPELGWKPTREAILRAADRGRALVGLPPAPRADYG